jgi:predicted nucleic-acid-binding Zn-ribbon protein
MKDHIMNPEKNCLRCGSTNLKPGSFQSTGKVYFRASDAKLLTLHTSGVVVDAIGCFDCGHIELTVDPKKIRNISRKS